MKKTIKLAVVAALALGATSAFATNGDHLIGLGAKSRAMGGTGVAVSHGAESGLANPALIANVKGSEVSVTATIFMPNVSNSMGSSAGMNPAETSDADMSVIPEISYATKVNDSLTIGLGAWGTAGMGVDYSGDANNFNMETELQLMQIGVPIAYTIDALTIGVAPILQYGSLNIAYSGGLDASTFMSTPGAQAPVAHSADVATDIGFGYTIGLAYELDALTLGLVYKSAIEMDYKDQISGATAPFAGFGLLGGSALSDVLEQPAEIGLGVSYVAGEHTIAVDYKSIKWSDTAGYGDFGWDDQTVVAVGYEYQANGWAARVGYNKGTNPVAEQAQGDGGTGAALNMFNLIGFPATVESHISLGGTYEIDSSMSLDVAYVIAQENTTTYSMGDFVGFGPQNPTIVETIHSQSSASVQFNYVY